MSDTAKQYAERDVIQLDRDGNYYCRHVRAMTAEGLHSKSDIAAELAWRDREIDRLRATPQEAAPRAAEADWQPIESAPKDGAWVLLTGGGVGYGWDGGPVPEVVAGQYTNELNGGTTEYHWQFAWYDGGYYGVYESPTHWRPLPAPPALTPPSAKGE